MSKTLLVTAFPNGGSNTTAGATEYYWLVGHINKSSTEAQRDILFRTAGTLSGLYVRVQTNATSASSTVRTRKNASNGSQTITIGSAATGEFEDTTNTDSVSAGDKLCVQTITGTGGAINFRSQSTIFDATTDTCTICANTGPVSTTAASTTYYYPISGYNGDLTTVSA